MSTAPESRITNAHSRYHICDEDSRSLVETAASLQEAERIARRCISAGEGSWMSDRHTGRHCHYLTVFDSMARKRSPRLYMVTSFETSVLAVRWN